MAKKIKPNFKHPIKSSRPGATKAYSLVLIDADDVEHFFDEYGNYEGWGKEVKN